MNIIFNLPYRTAYGEELLLNIAEAGTQPSDDSQYGVHAMTTRDGQTWSCAVDLAAGTSYDYYYSVRSIGVIRRKEWTTVVHRIDLNAAKARRYVVCDRWNDLPCDTYLYSSAFTDCVNRRPATAPADTGYSSAVRLVVRAPQLRSGMRLHVSGACTALGAWHTDRALPMAEHTPNEWTADVDAVRLFGIRSTPAGARPTPQQPRTIEFKFVALGDKGEVEWETGLNRTLRIEPLGDGDVRQYTLDQAFFALCDEKVAGTLIPVFSLRSEGSFGVGDFGDLKLMTDWVAQTHQRVLQVLPINDTTSTHTWTDSYPYSCISVFALHPQYADLRQLPPLKDRAEAQRFERLRAELNALPQIDYERVSQAKTQYLRLLYAQEGRRTLASDGFRAFFGRAQHWLVPYAQYCHLRDRHGTCRFDRWKGHEHWHEKDRKALSNPSAKAWRDVAFYYYVQYVLDCQMRSAHEYARARGIILKGDIPIGVNRSGCDVWHEPEYFLLDSQAGAPPDAFATDGQNWGFPTYNWQRMTADGCRWWVRRFQNMAQYFDAYRIDHVLGFFRIWAIPTDCLHGLLGQFQPALAMTRAEIQSYGLAFDDTVHTRALVSRHDIGCLLGGRADDAIETYMQAEPDGMLALKPQYDTERKIEAAFDGHDDADSAAVRNALYRIVENVLFVRDRQNPEMFHPRITAQTTPAYASLPDSQKQAFDRLYNDYFYRRNNDFWYREAMKKLPLLVQATRMLVCAEDLGMVPHCVPGAMADLRILSLELQSMPKEAGLEFGLLQHNPYRSVCTLSTHDMPTLRQWWDEDGERTQRYYNTVLYRSGEAPHPLPGWLAADIIRRQLDSPSMLCIMALQDWLSIDEHIRLADANAERINIPANPHHYWRYRMHVTIERLMADRDFCDAVKELVGESGRRL